MSFATLHTNAGLTLIADAQATGVPINLTDMAVGDGNGNPVTPNPTQTGLVREVYRAAINRVFKPDPSGDPLRFSAELVVPASEGGFTMREVGIFTADGTLFAVGNLPATYKPEATEGAFADTVVRLDFKVDNASVITLQIDPNVAIATQRWVTNNITAATIIPGGTTQQVLRKVSNADGDYEWSDPTDANVTVTTIEERQTLAAAQTVVDLAIVNTVGMALYIDGLRLPIGSGAEEWEPDLTDVTKLTLGQAYPAGSKLLAVQNEPAGSLPEALRRDQNLADVPDKALGRQNLGVPSIAQMVERAPPSTIGWFSRSTAPAGWLKANGAAVSRSVYSDLFNAIGTTFGAGNGSTTFNLPDYRGEFLRGWDDGRGVDSGRAFGSAQAAFAGTVSRDGWGTTGGPPSGSTSVMQGRIVVGSGLGEGAETLESLRAAGGNRAVTPGDTRPRNSAALICVKF